MALRFRTRLNLTIAALVFLVVTVMTVVVLVIFVTDSWSRGWEVGRNLTILANQNIAYGLDLSDRFDEYMQDQMVVEAYLTAELVALAEAGSLEPNEISAALRRVIARAQAYKGRPLVSEFNVTDSRGQTYITTRDDLIEFVAESGENSSQSEEFLQLLSPEAPPVVQQVRERDVDGEPFKYVGVTGSDRPRIIQVGASGETVSEFAEYFSEQKLVERFMLPDEYITMAVIDPQGRVIAEVGETAAGEPIRDEIIQFCVDFLRSPPPDGVAFQPLGRNLGVVTPLTDRDEAPAYALFILHNTSRQFEFILERIAVLSVVGFMLFVMAVVVGVFVSRGLSKPLVELAHGAREFGEGNLNYRLRLRRKDEFNDLAQSFNTMAISIQEYMHELEQETSRRERFESEFRIAAEVQRTLLPEAPPEVEGLEFCGWSQPSREVGGDFYDFIRIDDHRVAAVIGDATGKGISAALLTTQCASILGTLAHHDFNPARLLKATNEAFFERIGVTHRFVTLSFLLFDTQTRTVTYSSAGHPPPLLVNAQNPKSHWLTCKPGFPLGIVRDASYDEVTLPLKPGDTVLLYSDGLSEAHNPQDAMYGEERIGQTIARHAHERIDTIQTRLREDVERHMNGREAIDDLTLVLVRFTG
jgi:phosphoserine phosphatase RsbU/P